MKTLPHPMHFRWQNAITLPKRILGLIYDLRLWSFMSGSLFLAILVILLFMALQAH